MVGLLFANPKTSSKCNRFAFLAVLCSIRDKLQNYVNIEAREQIIENVKTNM